MRISDAASLKREAFEGKRLQLYQAKTGEYVSVLLPDHVVKALHTLPGKLAMLDFQEGLISVWRQTFIERARFQAHQKF